MIEDDIATPAPLLRKEIRRLRELIALNAKVDNEPNIRVLAVSLMAHHLCGIKNSGDGYACACTGHCMGKAETIMQDLEKEGLIVLRIRVEGDGYVG